MQLSPQIFSIHQGADETVRVTMSPPQNIDTWNLEFRAKSSVVNPDMRTMTILGDDLSIDATTLKVTDPASFPFEGAFKIRIDNEVLLVDVGSGYYSNGCLLYDWLVERAIHGTTAATHARGARVHFFEQPQLFMDNGNQGGVIVQDVNLGLIDLAFSGTSTQQRPAGVYFWNLRRTDVGQARPVAQGVMYLLPDALSGLLYPPVHGIY